MNLPPLHQLGACRPYTPSSESSTPVKGRGKSIGTAIVPPGQTPAIIQDDEDKLCGICGDNLLESPDGYPYPVNPTWVRTCAAHHVAHHWCAYTWARQRQNNRCPAGCGRVMLPGLNQAPPEAQAPELWEEWREERHEQLEERERQQPWFWQRWRQQRLDRLEAEALQRQEEAEERERQEAERVAAEVAAEEERQRLEEEQRALQEELDRQAILRMRMEAELEPELVGLREQIARLQEEQDNLLQQLDACAAKDAELQGKDSEIQNVKTELQEMAFKLRLATDQRAKNWEQMLEMKKEHLERLERQAKDFQKQREMALEV